MTITDYQPTAQDLADWNDWLDGRDDGWEPTEEFFTGGCTKCDNPYHHAVDCTVRPEVAA